MDSVVVGIDVLDRAAGNMRHLDQLIDVAHGDLVSTIEAMSSVLCDAVHTSGFAHELPVGPRDIPLPPGYIPPPERLPAPLPGSSTPQAFPLPEQAVQPPPGPAAGPSSPAPGTAAVLNVPTPVSPPMSVTPPTAPPPKPIPWRYVAAGAAVAVAVVAIGLGGASASAWNKDHTNSANGVVYHSITRVQADRANTEALTADILFGGAGVLAAGSAAWIVYRW
jgi:hypothetical protein